MESIKLISQKGQTVGLLIFVVFALCVSGCSTSKSNQGTTNTLDAIKQKGYMVFATDGAYPPMEFTDENNEVIGFDIDLGKAICEKLGVEYRSLITDWEGLIPGLVKEKYDAITSSMNITEERLKSVDFVPYFHMGELIVVGAGNPKDIRCLQDLVGKTVAVQTGTTNENMARSVEGANIRLFSTFTDAMMEVASGRADACVLDDVVAKYYMIIKPGVYEIASDVFFEAPIGIAINKEAPELTQAIEKILDEFKEDGTYDSIAEKWFGSDWN
ncbi:MAG: basic amino acid ABC transporter substrate-binding protein [Firmicutes bacterium]|nr:basic amino acid ABC transporter substrate-binding protein [Bacillota bacterium]